MIQSFDTSLRVALVSGGLKLGGSTTFLCNLAGELIRRGIAAEVVSFEKENPLASDFAQQHIPVTCFDDRRCIFEDRMQMTLAALRRFQPTVVLATLSATSFEVLRYLPPGVFRVAVAQSDDPRIYPGIANYAGHLDAVAAVSAIMRQKMAAQPPLAKIPVHYLPYGVPMRLAAKLPPRAAAAPLRILYLGRLWREQKRVHVFPGILRGLAASGQPFHWTIAGEGEELEFLQANLKSPAPSQTVAFAGRVSYAAVPALLQQHDIFLLASDYEGLPLSLLEAMSQGLVPVVSDLKSGIPEVVNATNGCLVPVEDVGGYARAILHLHHHRDELVAKSLAARARVRQEFSVAAMTDRWLAIFPQGKPTIGGWPDGWKIRPLLATRKPLYFSPPVRALRRIAAKLRS